MAGARGAAPARPGCPSGPCRPYDPAGKVIPLNVLALLLTLAVAVSSTLLVIATLGAGRRVVSGTGQVHDLSEAAFLSGGPARVVDTAFTALHTDGRLAVGGPGIIAVRRGPRPVTRWSARCSRSRKRPRAEPCTPCGRR